ncbi:MAG: hypothetical protein KOO60_14420, partial [Gemmatimonadales bacterium]|nr:hypothetical protein [Gemmatimonadales bacterium]
VPSQNSIALSRLHLRKQEPSIDPMLNIIFKTIFSSLRSRQSLVLENIALRHQLEVLRRNNKTPRLRSRDRLLWIILSQIHTRWRSSLAIVQPSTRPVSNRWLVKYPRRCRHEG